MVENEGMKGRESVKLLVFIQFKKYIKEHLHEMVVDFIDYNKI